MPIDGGEYYPSCRLLDEAKKQVKAKFPDLPEGSSGWWRAIENRKKRLAKR